MLKRLAAGVLAAIAAGAVFVGHPAGQPSVAGSPVSACHKVEVTDAHTGRPLRGIEDIAVNAAANIAYLSADDRWAVEEGAARNVNVLPQGGIYLLPLDDAFLGADRLEVADLTTPFKTGNVLHPHGIDLVFDASGRGILYVINRRYQRRHQRQHSGRGSGGENGRWEMVATVEVFDVGEAGALHHRQTVRDRAFCRANGIVGLGRDRFLVSNDGAACGGWARRWELALGLKRGNVVRVELDEATGASAVTPLAEGIAFANGLAVDTRHLYVAATRDQALLVYPLGGLDAPEARARPERIIAVGGGPDNLSWASEHVLLVAVHPSLLRLAAYRHRWTWLADAAPTRIIAVDVRDGSQRTLYASDTGEPLSAATIAVVHGDFLIAGSVTDKGLMLCPLSEPGG
jgi:sugar lactone lactonase YvrE